MIIKGTSRAGPGSLATHLGNAEKNERVRVLETKNTIATDLRGALAEMDAYAAGSRCEKPLYHAAISPEPPHRLTPEQRSEAIDALEQKLGLEEHARLVVLHEKEGREHVHVVWSRIDLDTMRAVHDGHNYRKHEEVARDLERRFGHDRVQGAHAERESVERPDRTPSRAELRQEERTGIKGKQIKEEVSALFRLSDGPEAFKTALEEHGYTLAKGDRRDFVIVDSAGGIHSLARRIDSMKAANLRAFMGSLDRESLPTAAEAQIERRELSESLERAGGFAETTTEPKSHEPSHVDQSWEPNTPDGLTFDLAPAEARDVDRAALQVVDAASGVAEKLGDFIADFFTSGNEGPRDPAAGQAARIVAQRRAAAALENIRECIVQGRAIGVDDLRCLSPEDIRGIKDKGDDYLRALCMRAESDRERGHERER